MMIQQIHLYLLIHQIPEILFCHPITLVISVNHPPNPLYLYYLSVAHLELFLFYTITDISLKSLDILIQKYHLIILIPRYTYSNEELEPPNAFISFNSH